MSRLLLFLLAFASLSAPPPGVSRSYAEEETAQEPIDDGEEANIPLAGHSEHGGAYNEGPRQNAYLMGGTGQVDLKVTTSNEQAQAFFDQGLGQLYGFWYYEAERSFRRVVTLDPDCAMGYWGLAQANLENKERGATFITEAHEKRELVGEHQRMYIDALHTYLTTEGEEKELRSGYIKGLEKIIRKYPEDVEVKAMLAVHLWQSSREGLPIVSHQAVDSLLEEVFRKVPNHPAHHFRIHLWDHEEPSQALASAAACGPAAPTIAHMWHMPGHIYSRLHRYHDAIFQQEASARADHAHMMRDGVLPDQIHNYAHNNEWLIRNLIHVGRAHDAMSLAKNMLELPQHPKYNTYSNDKMCSCKYGRRRLLQVHETFEMWDELVETSQSVYFPATEERELQIPRLRLLGVAHYRRGEAEELALCIQQLSDLADAIREETQQAGDDAEQELQDKWAKLEPKSPDEEHEAPDTEKDSETNKADDAVTKSESDVSVDEDCDDDTKEFKPSPEEMAEQLKKARKQAEDRASKGKGAVKRAIAELKGLQQLARGETDQAIEHFADSDCPKARLAEYNFLCGDHAKAVELLEDAVESGKNEVYPLAKQVDLLRRMGKRKDAESAFEKLRVVAGAADLDTPLLARMKKFAKELEYPTDWRTSPEPRDDVGNRPDLDTLGPLRWAPSPAKPWSLSGNVGESFSQTGKFGPSLSLSDFRGSPVLVIFYLGGECLHCVEQLHVFGAMQNEFSAAGISLVGISSESEEKLQTSVENYDTGDGFPIPLYANEDLSVFRAYRAFDDFENLPLHGTFLIDAEGLVRWLDISYEPFSDAEFLLEECQRLLSIEVSGKD